MSKRKQPKAGQSRLMSWADFTAGRWTKTWTDAPCPKGQRAAQQAFPAWPTGTPPTWAELIAAAHGNGYHGRSWARWLAARVLVRDRVLLVEWARISTFVRLDATEESTAKRLEGSEWADDVNGLRGELYAWTQGATADLAALRDSGWSIQCAADDAAAADAAADAAAAADDAAAAAADAADDAAAAYAAAWLAIMDGCLPLLDRAMAIDPLKED